MDSIIHLRFDEIDQTARPRDAAGALTDLENVVPADYVAIVDGLTGPARMFAESEPSAMTTTDLVAGATLLQRDMSVQLIAEVSLDGTIAAGTPGTFYARGDGSGPTERRSAVLEMRVVNAAARVMELRWAWDDAAGVLKTQLGGHFTAPIDGFVMLTATRRWVSSSAVVLRYYLNDRLLAEVPSANGDINGSVSASTLIGCQGNGAGGVMSYLCASLDELRVLDRELAAEEIAMTWGRIATIQPQAYQLMRELHPPGFPISEEPSSRVQRETNLWGQILGFAAAQLENIRANLWPTRAYGEILARWEAITARPARGGDSIDDRRRRVVASLRNRAGVSLPGVGAAIKEVAAADPSNLEFIGFSTDVKGLLDRAEVWHVEQPVAWTRTSTTARVQGSAGDDFRFEDGFRAPARMRASISRMPIQVAGRGAQILAKLAPTTIAAGSEVGVMLGNMARGDFMLLALRNTGGVYQVVTEVITGWVAAGATVRAAAALVPIWLHLGNETPTAGTLSFLGAGNTNYRAAWSTTSQLAGYSEATGITARAELEWCGIYARSIGGVVGAAGIDVTLSEVWQRQPFGCRALRWYVYRNPALVGSPDLIATHSTIQGMKHAHTSATIITSKSLLCDDASSGCDRGPMGAL